MRQYAVRAITMSPNWLLLPCSMWRASRFCHDWNAAILKAVTARIVPLWKYFAISIEIITDALSF